MVKIDRTLALINQSLILINQEIDCKKSGKYAIDSLRNLVFIRDRLENMQGNIISGKMDDENFKGSMSHIINDTWPINSVLGNAIAEAEYFYYRINRKSA